MRTAHVWMIGVVILLVTGAACGATEAGIRPVPGTRLAPADAAAGRSLDLEARVACHRAVEEVYWSHRTWPASNVEPRPTLADVLPDDLLGRKAEWVLRATSALATLWGQRIDGEPLQREMERMFADTRSPEVLREIAAALDDDAFLFAECVARPALAGRLLRSFPAQDERFGDEPLEAWLEGEPGGPALALEATDYAYQLPALPPSAGAGSGERWTPTASLPEGTFGISSVWTGSEMIIWGGARSNGSRYDPATDSWSTTAAVGAPSPRKEHSAVWTGAQMIVWGGCGQSSEFCEVASGGRYNPAADVWTPTATAGAPGDRRRHTALWSGTEMIVWGGCTTSSSGNNGCQNELNTGGRYDPSSDTWAPVTTAGAPSSRDFHTAVWTGSRMIVWGGTGGSALNTGGSYDPASDAWQATAVAGAPTARATHTAVWADGAMIVWGGCGTSVCYGGDTFFDSGAKYDPASNSWTPITPSGAPQARGLHSAVWTGSEMIVWGGATAAGGTRTGGRYDPATNAWSPTSELNAPSARSAHRAVWTGSQMVVWGAVNRDSLIAENT